MLPYVLAPHVRACASERGAVFLDLRRGAYVGFDSQQARMLCSLVEGLDEGSIAVQEIAGALRSTDADELVRSLCDHALLQSSSMIQPRATEHVVVADAELIPWEQMGWRHIRVGHVMVFLRALLIAIFLIKWCSLSRIITRVERRKGRRAPDFDVERARKLVSAYFHIRLFFYRPKARCLVDSLTLTEYLAYYDLYADWIIGVQINPFGSHSWVQHERFVLNGTPQYVRAYQPILIT